MLNVKARQDTTRKLRVLKYAKSCGNVAKTCRYFGIARQTFYSWKMAFERCSEQGLINSKPCSENPRLRVPIDIDIKHKIIQLRTTYYFGPEKIAGYLKRFHDISVSRTGCYYVLVRYRPNRLTQNCRKRSMPFTL